ncbi:MAG: bifunctional helix-turn-helix transcriptional regulator/GNAT family N-acetyltransferase [Thermomicrobiales bacterium]|nr:bifunctional helix-turn-helix transcriptional regulator/GNAT family N-acetyltransferase [Thermomicrobiales bacterium]
MTDPTARHDVDIVRRFSRTYTRTLGLLQEGYLESPYGLTEVRVLYELAHADATNAVSLASELGLDAGYLSRILGRLSRSGLITRAPSPLDRRQIILQLTEAGTDVVAGMEARSSQEISALLAGLSGNDQRRLTSALATAAEILDPQNDSTSAFVVRAHRPGDMGWIVSKHGSMYAEEFGWDATFEAVVARIVADFIDHFDSTCEHCWIAERDGQNIGSIALVKHPEREGVAKLRLLLVDPSARGLGLGKYLVNECLRFARHSGYRVVTLWTYSMLDTAIHLYQAAGFRLVDESPEHVFGRDLIEQTWELVL